MGRSSPRTATGGTSSGTTAERRQAQECSSSAATDGVRRLRVGTRATMEPIPETAAFFEEFGQLYDHDLLDVLRERAEMVRRLVPDLVGVSVAGLDDGVAFTLVATAAEVAVLDAIQYLVGGPCVDALPADRVLEYSSEASLDEELWARFGRATTAKGVASTLTLPILDGGKVVGTVNLYAASGRAFEGLHADIARVFDAWAPGAVTNADLMFRTRQSAETAPSKMRVEIAVGMLMEAESLDAGAARALLQEEKA